MCRVPSVTIIINYDNCILYLHFSVYELDYLLLTNINIIYILIG